MVHHFFAEATSFALAPFQSTAQLSPSKQNFEGIAVAMSLYTGFTVQNRPISPAGHFYSFWVHSRICLHTELAHVDVMEDAEFKRLRREIHRIYGSSPHKKKYWLAVLETYSGKERQGRQRADRRNEGAQVFAQFGDPQNHRESGPGIPRLGRNSRHD